jgi:hypothetical protein
VDLRDRQDVGTDLFETVDETVDALEGQYDDMLDRRPRISEVLASFAFVLGHEPETYLRVEPGLSVKEIVAEKAD